MNRYDDAPLGIANIPMDVLLLASYQNN